MTNYDQDVDRNLFDYVEILWRRKWSTLLVAAAVLGGFAAYAFYSTPIYKATATLDIEKPAEPFADPHSGGYIPTEEDYIPTQAKLISSDTSLRKVFEDLQLGATDEFSRGLAALRDAVTVLPVPRTRLCTISVESKDAKRASAIAQALADNYLRQNLSNQLFMPRKVLSDLDARAKAVGARRFYEEIPVVAAAPAVVDADQQIIRAEADLAKLRAVYKDDHPSIVAAANQLKVLRATRQAAVDRAIAWYRTQLSGALHANNARVVDPAEVPHKPVRPRKQLALLLGLVAGLAAGCIVSLSLETLDQSVRTHSDVERGLGLPVLGHIPLSRVKKGERIYAPLVSADMTSMSEAFRNLRTMLLFAKAADPDPFVLVTSTIQQEGKSFVAANLAVACSQLGRRVLLIDGDLRRPSQHRLLDAQPRLGLSDLLSGRVKDADQVLCTGEVPNLDILPAGTRPANPSELLSSEQMAALVRWARERYDRVVVDCPPVFPVSDVLLWGRHVRSTLLVSRAGSTRVPLIQMACSQLRAGGIDILGGVINGTRRNALGYAEGHDFDRYSRGLAELPPGEVS